MAHEARFDSCKVPFDATVELLHWSEATCDSTAGTITHSLHDSATGKGISAHAGGLQLAYIPGQPRLMVNDPNLWPYLRKHLLTPELDGIASRLWLISTPSSANIAPLHEHIACGRVIHVSENPRLHLTWLDGKIFIKPIPKYLLSHHFWSTFLCTTTEETHWNGGSPNHVIVDIRKAVLGLLRTFDYLIQSELDFDLALQHHLIPDKIGITYEAFIRFITHFTDLPDRYVSPRYRYGTLRLSRLNAWSPILLHRWRYHDVHRTYNSYFIRFFGPLIFAYASASVILEALQVALQAEPSTGTPEVSRAWDMFQDAAKWFAVALISSTAFVCLALVVLLVALVGSELAFVTRWFLRRARLRSGGHSEA